LHRTRDQKSYRLTALENPQPADPVKTDEHVYAVILKLFNGLFYKNQSIWMNDH